jgi:hypothetical protein
MEKVSRVLRHPRVYRLLFTSLPNRDKRLRVAELQVGESEGEKQVLQLQQAVIGFRVIGKHQP